MQKRDLHQLRTVRNNITSVLRYAKVIPFTWNTKSFRCFYCAKPMKDCNALKEHTLKHRSIDLDSFISKHIITKDVPVKIDIADIGCKVCATPYPNLEDLVSHIVADHGEEYEPSAGVCFFPFVLNEELMQCVLCDSNYDNFTSLIGHMYKQHISHSFICQMCGLSFRDRIRMQRHIRTSHMGHKCTICAKIFDALHKLEKHKQKFHGEVKLHECSLCSEKFSTGYQIKVHMGKVHNVEKYRIKCEHCPKVCNTKGAMVIHMKSLHSEMRYKCDLCEYSAAVKWSVTLHKRKHYGLKEYSCSICDRHFGRSSNLRIHMKVHTGYCGRVCRVCRKGFTDGQALKEHELKIH